MDPQAARTSFDGHLRRRATAEGPDGRIEYDDRVTRSLSPRGGWSGITWCRLGDLDLDLTATAPPGTTLRPVVGQGDVDRLVAVHDEVFGGDHSPVGRALSAGLARRPPMTAAVLALAEDVPIAAGRLDFHHGTDFASLWGGGTVPAWRCRGAFRALVAHRAAAAAAAGFRYLQVDATGDSSPILQRLGFRQLGTATAYTHPGSAAG